MVSYSGAAAVMFVTGSLLSRVWDVSWQWILIFGVLLVMAPVSFCAAVHFTGKKEVWILAIIPAFLFAGFAITKAKTDEALRPLYPYKDKEVEIVGTICSLPVKYDENTQFMLEVSSVNGVNVKEKIKVSTNQAVPEPRETIRLQGKLKSVSLPKNSTSFDSNSYNKRRGVFFTLYGETLHKAEEDAKLSLKSNISLFTQISAEFYIKRFSGADIPLLKGIILNNKSEIPNELTEAMLKTGTYRYIYCPYLHISLLVFVLSGLMGNRRSKPAALVCLFFLYLFMNVTIASAWKICLFFGLSYALMGFYKMKDIKAAMYLTVLFTGIFSPLTLTEPGFVISVTATVLVRAFSESITRVLYPLLHNRKLSQFVAIYLIISVGIYPICSFFGYGITPWSFILGMVLMPITALIYVAFYMGFGIFVFTGRGLTLGIPYLLKAVTYISETASKLPLASINLGKCSILFILAFYFFLYCIYRRLRYRRSVGAEITTILLCIAFAISGVYGINDAELTFLSVGNADCAIITLPNRKTVMIDGGGSEAYSNYDIGSAEVIPYLKANGINKIDSIILSHYDKDHADGVITVIKNMPVGQIFVADYLPNEDTRAIIEKEAKTRNIKINYISNPCTYTLADKLKCEFIHFENGDDGNDNSLVARIIYGETSILFTGDISKFVEYKLPEIKADILKVAHHGSKTSSSESFIQKTDPEFSVISVGENNPYGHPDKAVVSRYEKSGTHLLRTDHLGDIHFIIGKDRIKRVYGFKRWLIYGGF